MRGLRTAECGVWIGPAVMLAVALALSVVAIPWPADAQQPGKTYRIGWLAPARVPSDLDAFRDGLRGLGYVEGKNVVIEQRYPDRQGEPLAGLAAELTQANVDIFVTTGRLATSAAKSLATATPVVFITGDPLERGYAASLARPGGTMTGLSMIDLDLTGKRMELLKEAFPRMSRLAVLVQVPATTAGETSRETAARSLGLQLVRLDVRVTDDIERAFASAVRERVDALMAWSSPFFHAERVHIVRLAAQYRLPAMYEHRSFPDAGGLMSYGSDIRAVYRRVATYVDKILKGADPADLPVEQPTNVELVVNLKTAKTLGLTIPQSVLFRADEVIR